MLSALLSLSYHVRAGLSLQRHQLVIIIIDTITILSLLLLLLLLLENTNFTKTADWRRGISVNIHNYCVAPPLPWESWGSQFEVSGPNIIMTLRYKGPHLLDNPALFTTEIK